MAAAAAVFAPRPCSDEVLCLPCRRADALRTAQGEAEGLRRLQPKDQGPVPAEGSG